MKPERTDRADRADLQLVLKMIARNKYTPTELANSIGVSRQTVYNWIQGGTFKLFSPPSRVYTTPLSLTTEKELLDNIPVAVYSASTRGLEPLRATLERALEIITAFQTEDPTE